MKNFLKMLDDLNVEAIDSVILYSGYHNNHSNHKFIPNSNFVWLTMIDLPNIYILSTNNLIYYYYDYTDDWIDHDPVKSITKKNYLTLTSSRQVPNKILQQKMLSLFKYDNLMFEALYVRMNTICRNKMCDMINGNLNATKQWIEEEFRLERDDAEVPMVLVKAVESKAESQSTDPLRDFLPTVTSANAYLKTGSVQEWFIDLHDSNNNKMTLTMTIRSDSEYREKKQKGKLGAFMMLKLLYRG